MNRLLAFLAPDRREAVMLAATRVPRLVLIEGAFSTVVILVADREQ